MREPSPISSSSPPRARDGSTPSGRSSPARPTTPGTYLFRDASGQVLYVGRARDLRARLRSYFAGGRQRPAVEAALGALDARRVARGGIGAGGGARRAPAAARAPPARERARHPPRPARLPRGAAAARWSVTREPTPLGPLDGRVGSPSGGAGARRLRRRRPRAALPALRARLRRLVRRAPLRGRRAAARPDRRARDRRRALDELERRACAPRLRGRAGA